MLGETKRGRDLVVGDRIREEMPRLTSSERKVATALLADYPFGGLMTVAELGKRANVSGQTILRLASKLGFDGYSAFQRTLIGEIKEGYHSPVILRESRGDGDFLGGLIETTIDAMRETSALVSDTQLDAVSGLLSDQRHAVYLLGGRMSNSLADYFFLHLRQIRPKTYKVPGYQEEWPEYLLRMSRNDIVVLFDYRRYQPDLLLFAERAVRQRGARVVLFTDKWLSPIAKLSQYSLPAAIDVGTPWDTAVSSMMLIEALINRASEADWPKTRKRIENWDALRMPPDAPHPEDEE